MKRVLIIIVSVLAVIVLIFSSISVVSYWQSARLCKLIENNETEKAIHLISNIRDVNHYSAPLWTRKIMIFIDYYVDYLPLVAACRNDNYEVVKALLNKGADPNKHLDESWSPIEVTFAQKGDNRFIIANELINHGADVDLHSGLQSALFKELSNLMYNDNITEDELKLSVDSINLLLDNGASPIDNRKNTIIHYIAGSTATELLEEKCCEYPELIGYVDDLGETPLHWAADRNSVDNVRVLLDYGVDINVKDSYGKTALDYAKENNNSEIIDLLSE